MEISLVQTGYQEYLEKEEEVLAIYLFGSQAEDLTHPRSDIDLAVLLRPETDKSRYTEYRLKLLQELKKFFPKKLDLIVLNQVPPLLQFEVLKNGRLLFDRDPDIRARLEMEILGRYYNAKRFYDFHFDRLIARIKKEGLGRGYKGHKNSLKEVRRISEEFSSL